MQLIKITGITSLKTAVLLGLLLSSPWMITDLTAQTVDLSRLNQGYKTKQVGGSRIDKLREKRCRNCDANTAREKSEYLKRVVTGKSSNDYQRLVESMIFSDAGFINGCWKNAVDRGMEFFFTVNEEGLPDDFAWFPKHRSGKCIRQYISKIEFPQIDKPHHSWLLVTGQEY